MVVVTFGEKCEKGSSNGNTKFGLEAGINLTNATGVVIIGDYIRDLSRDQKNVLFLGDRVAIGTSVMGRPINGKEVIEQIIGGVEAPRGSLT